MSVQQSYINDISPSLTQSEPGKKIHSILKDRRCASDDITRRDYNGTPIQKGSKQHKIKFRDQNEVYIVENWKSFNEDVAATEPPCVCKLF